MVDPSEITKELDEQEPVYRKTIHMTAQIYHNKQLREQLLHKHKVIMIWSRKWNSDFSVMSFDVWCKSSAGTPKIKNRG